MKQTLVLIAFAICAFIPNYFPALPPVWLLSVGVGVFFCLGVLLKKTWVWVLLLGLTLGVYQADKFNKQLLPDAQDGERFLVAAVVDRVAAGSRRSQRLELSLDAVSTLDGQNLDRHPSQVLLSWYGDQQLSVGDKIYAEAKLRRPRGLANPGLFDYGQWLYSEGFTATGYIREIIQLDKAPQADLRIDQWRYAKSQFIAGDNELRYAGVHRALALGDGDALDRDLWSRFTRTGTVHLMVISGLHVGLVAGIGYLLGFAMGRILSPVYDLNAVRTGILTSLVLATVYALVSGFDLPAKRALVMAATILIPRYFYLRVSPWLSLAAALAIISVLEPRAPMQTGFWLSFGAVFLIFVGFSGAGKNNFFLGLARTQLLFFVSFTGVLLWQGIQVPTNSFLANLIAVPLVSLLLVPLEVFALSTSVISESVALSTWRLCDLLVHLLIQYLDFVLSIELPELTRPGKWGWIQILAVVASIGLWVVPQHVLRFMLLVASLPLIVAPTDDEVFLRVRIFDVGQGTSVLVQHRDYHLLYDTGPKFSDSFDSGQHILAPTLKQMRVNELDRLIVSHPDFDHRGGVEGLLSDIDVGRLDVGKPLELTTYPDRQHLCREGQRWSEGDLSFRYLWPEQERTLSDNDSSCVLLVEAGEISILIPGDITAVSEWKLLQSAYLPDQIDLLLVPHHGSKTSSSPQFIRAIAPEMAVVSAGYQNQFNHPHPDIVDRYLEYDVALFNTANAGAIDIYWESPTSAPKVIRATDSKSFWWQK